MKLTYEQIREIYYYRDNQFRIIDMVSDKYNIEIEHNEKCLNCGKRVQTTGWLCSDNEHQCIVSFFNDNHDLLVEVITREA